MVQLPAWASVHRHLHLLETMNTGIKVEPIIHDGVEVGTRVTSAEFREGMLKIALERVLALRCHVDPDKQCVRIYLEMPSSVVPCSGTLGDALKATGFWDKVVQPK